VKKKKTTKATAKPKSLSLYEALANAQAEIGQPMAAGANSYFKNHKYVKLSDLYDHIFKVLPKHGIAITSGQTIHFAEKTETDANGNTTQQPFCAGHIFWVELQYGPTGESKRSEHFLSRSNDMHEVGSGLTYMRRYLTQALLGLGADPSVDDDGNSAVDGQKARSAKGVSGVKDALKK